MAHAGVEAMLAGRNVELPTVPRAGDDISTQRSFTERSAGMRADAVERVELPIDIEQGHNPVVGHYFFR